MVKRKVVIYMGSNSPTSKFEHWELAEGREEREKLVMERVHPKENPGLDGPGSDGADVGGAELPRRGVWEETDWRKDGPRF
jgi:hypothetical protein